jgi:hypothetical protein
MRITTTRAALAGLITTIASVGLMPGGVWAIDYDEAVDGDLSGDRLAPTLLSVGVGSNRVSANSGPGDREYFSINVGSGFALSAIILDAFAGDDPRAFIGVQTGSTFTVDFSTQDPSSLLGYALFGPFDPGVGNDMLQLMGEGPGAIGFTGPLAEGVYTFWAQQTGAASTYTLDLQITQIPEPSLLGLAACTAITLRRRK